ncbi:GMC family oxidoreductase N-terminal domain-containing protein [Pseudomonas sp. BW7P1]|uniref:GMC family oxidoreductase N-terminal domain-containing protein n=1 Tax=Pseudomonas TaxID=286 RepID=UPI0021ADD977|nr:GMC oxidoreductase [Pseudomonas sp. BW7P1]UWI61534.1 GMC family oxidoreductase N-terminal domain-containing protein [Pseudomonas sp. BW7P1]
MTRIATPISDIKEHYDVIVIGSGYGGGIAASRLSRAGKRVCLLERGREIQPGEYPNTMIAATEELQVHDPDGHIGSRTGLFDLHVNAQQNVVVGCGLGGTSLINANVSLEPTADVFKDPRWPLAVREDQDGLLKAGYEKAREMLKPNPYPDTAPDLPKLDANKKSADFLQQSAHFYKPPINVTFDKLPNNLNHVGVEQLPCNHCGDCVSGCNNKAKNTTLMNYLPDATNHGAEIFCQAQVRHLERDGDGWIVHFQYLDSGREKFDAPTLFVKADIVVVSAGTLGSTEILLRSRDKGLVMSGQLGENMSGNGDILGFGHNCAQTINGIGFGTHSAKEMKPVGPCITSIIDMRTEGDRSSQMVIEEGSIPGALGRPMVPAMAGFAELIGVATDDSFSGKVKYKEREAESFLRGPYYGALHNMQTYLIMSHDSGQGRMVLDDKDQLRIDWPGVGEQENFRIGNERLHQSTKALGGIWVENPIWTKLLRHSIVSVHPLGGCVMGEDATQGVVNHKGQVFSGASGTDVYANLYVTDGAVIPTSLAVNPLLTISAVSERNMGLLAADRGWKIDYTLPSAPRKQPVPPTLGVQFTETMKGYFSRAFTAAQSTDLKVYEAAAKRGEADNSPIDFTLTITASDLNRMIKEPEHAATIVGTVNAPALSPQPLTASNGVFNLFEQFEQQVDTRHMKYDMKLTAEDGNDYFFSAFKTVPEDNGVLNIWHDTSTLYVTLYRGPDKSGEVIGSGVMHIKPADFAKQMTTMKVLNARNERERIEGLARFGKFFAGILWESYGGVFAGDKYFNPDAPPRLKRPLDAPTPDVHFFPTEDGVELRLSRYQAGSKGPVMLVHGLGVGSNIFSTDTIQTNLLEFLCKHDYDVWLLDFRVSILLPASKKEWNGDQIARYDFKAAIAQIQQKTGAKDVQCVVHCYGATTFFMSLLAGLQGVRSVVCSQIAADTVVATATGLKAGLHLPGMLDAIGIKSMTAYADSKENWFNRLYDKALNGYARIEAQGYCTNPVCHRITFMYASLYRHDTLNETLHDNLHELFGESNIETFEHLALIVRKGHLVDFKGNDVYMPHFDRLTMPICFISGAENQCYLPESTLKTYQRVCEKHGPERYSRHVVPGYGHIDCMFGKNAVVDVYPIILEHLEKTALG